MIKIRTIATAIITAAILSISAGAAYDAAKAIAYAKANVYNSKSGLCAQYVSESINSGGIDCYSVSCSELVKQLEKSGKGKLVTLVKNSDGSVSYSANKNKISIGDVLFWKCGCDKKNYVHAALYSGHDSKTDTLQVYARNKSKSNEIIFYSCGYCGSNKVTPIAFHFTNAITKPSISAPTQVKVKAATVGNTSTISWGAVSGAHHYDVEIYCANGTLLKKYYNLRKNDIGYRFTESGRYYVYVAAVSDENGSSWKFAPKVEVNITAIAAKDLTLTDLPKGMIKGYIIPNKTVRDLYANSALNKKLSGEIWTTDLIEITEIGKDYLKIRYPISSGYKSAYVNTSMIFNSNTVKQIGVKYDVTVYRRSSGSATIGSAWTTDKIFQIGLANNNRVQIVCEVGNYWKTGWIPVSAIK